MAFLAVFLAVFPLLCSAKKEYVYLFSSKSLLSLEFSQVKKETNKQTKLSGSLYHKKFKIMCPFPKYNETTCSCSFFILNGSRSSLVKKLPVQGHLLYIAEAMKPCLERGEEY